jgi:hypothetical protein
MEEEASKLAQFAVDHGPTIGDMYEGLSAEVLTRALPEGLDLRVVSGFVVDLQGQVSGQIDCMLVRGEGEQIPFTDTYKWPVRDVLAVFEIKKTLSYRTMREAFVHLRGVYESYKRWLDVQPKDVPIEVGSALRAFALMTGFHSKGRTDDVPYHLRLLHYTLVVEQLSPVRIIWAYGGYKTQIGLREAMIRMLNEALADDALGSGFGVPCFPHMISCNGISLVKANGQPYSPPVEQGVWPFLLSSVTNPVWLMLEFIWAKIENVYETSMPFGDGLIQEALVPFLSAKHEELDGGAGWFYKVADWKNLDVAAKPTTEWAPIELTAEQFTLVHSTDERGVIDTTEERFVTWITQKGLTVEGFVADLQATRLFAFDGKLLHPNFDTLHTVITPEGKFFAARHPNQMMQYLEATKRDADRRGAGDGG